MHESRLDHSMKDDFHFHRHAGAENPTSRSGRLMGIPACVMSVLSYV
jgi:hypothetical protein